ncbi:MAG TPA: hypothetical protein VJX74_12150 [Blastocatellia bacterium]|nr:hypothetical protein [Blastocatellia bacterium]
MRSGARPSLHHALKAPSQLAEISGKQTESVLFNNPLTDRNYSHEKHAATDKITLGGYALTHTS